MNDAVRASALREDSVDTSGISSGLAGRTTATFHIAMQLVEVNAMPEPDLSFFCTHQEVGRMVERPDSSIVRRALHRRRIFAQ